MDEEITNLDEKSKDERPQIPKRRRGGLTIGIVILVVLAYLGIAPRLSQAQKLRRRTDSIKNAAPLVSVTRLTQAQSGQGLTLPCNIQAIEETNINAQTSGYVKQRFVDIGSRVKQGQLLAVIQSPTVDQQLDQTEAEAAKSRADLGQATADGANSKAAISSARADEAKAAALLMQTRASFAHSKAKESQAEALLAEAKANHAAAGNQLSASKADLNRANAGLTIAQKTLSRWKELEKGDAVSGQDVDEKEADYEANLAQVQAAQDHVSSAEASLQETSDAINSAISEVGAAKADVEASGENVSAAQAATDSARAKVVAATASYRASQSNVEAASASVYSQQASVRRVMAMQSFERIEAPFSGVITARNVDVGDLVNPSSGGSGASDQMNTVTKTGLFGLAKTDVLRAQVDIPEEYVPSIHIGEAANVTVSELPGKGFPGSVFNISGALDAASRTLLVEVRVPNSSAALKPGMFAEIHFGDLSSKKELRIPANALIFDSKGTRVAIVRQDSTIHYVPVTLGRDYGDQIEVLDGLKDGDEVVTNADDSLPEGGRVAVARTP